MAPEEQSPMIRADKLLLAMDILGIAANTRHVPQDRRLSQLKAVEYIRGYHPALEMLLVPIYDKIQGTHAVAKAFHGTDLTSVELNKLLASDFPFFKNKDRTPGEKIWCEALDDLMAFYMSFATDLLQANDFRYEEEIVAS